jgi:SAM-dependent methyltransferase
VINQSHLTAIHRTQHSAPVKYLLQHKLLVGRILDYGCGRGTDCDLLQCDGYDPYYRAEPPRGSYNTIYCVYVLNVIPTEKERQDVLQAIRRHLAPEGTAYIAVRRDKKSLNGWTHRGTYQTNVELSLPCLVNNASFAIYVIKSTTQCTIAETSIPTTTATA